MSHYRKSSNIKLALISFGFILIIGLLAYSNSIVNQLREDNREIVKVYSEIIAKTVNEDSDANLSFIFDEIIKKVQFPIIYSDAKQNPIFSRNLNDNKSSSALLKTMLTMNQQNKPIPIIFNDPKSNEPIKLGFLHYGDSELIQKLKWLPYLEIGAVAIFIFIGFVGFNTIRNSEKRNIWVGMAKETAHQLGTPVSALMGWVDRIKMHPEETNVVVSEMESDLDRLSQIGNRFSNMGSDTPLKSLSLKDLVDEQTVYLKKRMPSLGRKIDFSVNSIEDINILGNATLLGWAIENLIRNGIDSIKHDRGEIELFVSGHENFGVLRIKDNGSGINKKNWKNIFRPGFSTKKRGWGLGLSLVRRIIKEIHNGDISVIQSEPDTGTTLEIRLKKAT